MRDKIDIKIGDRVQTIKGKGTVSYVNDDMTFIVDLDCDHGSYYFSKDSAWKINEKQETNPLYTAVTDKQKLSEWLNLCKETASFEDIVYSYMTVYSCDFSTRRINDFQQSINKHLSAKIDEVERAARIAHERATYLKCYLEGKMYASEEVARECVDLQIENAKAILESTERVAL